MGYLTLLIEDGDLKLNNDSQLVLLDDITQSYKVLIATQFESDYRDPTYGFKLYELIGSDYDDKITLIRLFVVECIYQHMMTESITKLDIEEIKETELYLQGRRYSINIAVKLKNIEKTIEFGVEING